jgi:hypothetical protein
MIDMTIFLSVIFGFVLLRGWLDQRSKERIERIRVLEAAIRNPAVDRATVNQIAEQLNGQKPISAAKGMALVLAVGWITLFVGCGMLLMEIYDELPGMRPEAIFVVVVGFAVVTYPFALRELELRRSQS